MSEEKRKYEKSPENSSFRKYVKEKWYSGKNLASAIGVSPVTIYANCKNPKGAYKLVAGIYEDYCQQREMVEALQSSFAELSQRYNDLLNKPENPVKEYLEK